MAGPNVFAGARLDRVAWRRTDAAWLAAARANPAARELVTVGGELAVGADGALLRIAPGTADPLEGTAPVLLGERDGAPLFSVEAAQAPPGARLAGLRELGPVLPQEEGGLAAFAAAMGTWHRRHRFCANCGAATTVGEAGFVRSCARCAAQHHPRTDPVVIMLVTDGDRVLLGRQPTWPAGRYSALAGFVEPGESLEEAVAREVAEEAGVRVDDVRYRSSQPWPFPLSLMLGFAARYAGGEPAARDGELDDVRWFSRAELAEAAARDDGDAWILLPSRLAIARRLVDGWLAEG